MTDILSIMPREMRMMSERIFSLTALPSGFALVLSDLPMYSEKLGLGGFAHFEAAFGTLEQADPLKIAIVAENGPALSLDAGGQHGWIVTPSLIDLAGELVALHGRAEITVTNVTSPDELGVAAALAGRSGLDAEWSGDRFTAVPAPVADPVLDALMHGGTPIPADLWWTIYERARSALAPDTATSRRHAGVVIVTEDGTVIGRKDNDDESDTGFLSRSATETSREGASA